MPSDNRPENPPETTPDAGARPHLRLSDPKAMRAMAHPTRLALMDALSRREPLTATEAAEIVGESPTNCAFHLRTLAKYGFVEETAGGGGRRRPWRRVHSGYSLKDVALTDSETKLAANTLMGVVVDRWLERIRRVAALRPTFPDRWSRYTDFTETLMFLTPEEADRLRTDVEALMRPYLRRTDEPALRPADAEAVECISFTFPYDAAHRRED